MHFADVLEGILPKLSEATTSDIYLDESCNHGLLYDTAHAFPFIADHLSTISPSANIGYVGGNVGVLQLMSKFFEKSGYRGRFLVNQKIITTAHPNERLLPDSCELVDDECLCQQSDIFIFDAAMMHFPQIRNAMGISFPAPSQEAKNFVKNLQASFLRCVESEIRRLQAGMSIPRKFLLIGSQHTWFEEFASLSIETTLAPFGTHVRHGYIRSLGSHSAIISKVKKQIMRLGFSNKEKIKRMPILNKIARLVYRHLLIAGTKR
jgi:hypothetical protein